MAISEWSNLEPFYKGVDTFDEDWNKFNYIGKAIHYLTADKCSIQSHFHISTTLYHILSTFHHITHLKLYIHMDDSDLPNFYFDSLINLLSLGSPWKMHCLF